MSIPIAELNYKRGLRRHLADNGVTFTNVDGIVTLSDETLGLALIAVYNPLVTVRAEARVRILDEAAIRVNAIYPHIDAKKTDVISFYSYTVDMYSGGLPLPIRLQAVSDIRDTTLTKIDDVNAESDYQIIEAYDATVGW